MRLKMNLKEKIVVWEENWIKVLREYNVILWIRRRRVMLCVEIFMWLIVI